MAGLNFLRMIVYPGLSLMILLPVVVHAQFSDDFSDGNFTENPAWKGDSLQFEVNSERQLHLNSTGSDTSLLLTSSRRFENTEWNFWVRIAFNTSLNNYCRVYLAADSSDFRVAGALWLQIGGSSDSIWLVEKTTAGTKVLYRYNSFMTSHSSNFIRFRILHEPDDKWKMFIDTTGGVNYSEDGSFNYHCTVNPRWFGLFCRYTSSNAAKIWFDDFYAGSIIYDTVKPTLQSVEVFPDSTMRVIFSEQVDEDSALNRVNYRLHSGTLPQSAGFENGNHAVVILRWPFQIADGITDSLKVTSITDLSGNRINDTVVEVFFYRIKAYDVIINEIFADPEPSAGLPAEEFTELYNRTKFPLNLKGWTFYFGPYYKILPKIIIQPYGFLILSKTSAYKDYGDCVSLFTSSASLANEGTTLTVKNDRKEVIHTVTYDISWYQNNYKNEGGWSLEMTDTDNPCGCAENWTPSVDPSGGTPGRKNSTARENKDLQEPYLLHAYIRDSATLAVIFSEPVDSVTLLNPGYYNIISQKQRVLPLEVQPVNPDFRKVFLTCDTLFVRNELYTLKINDSIRDCAGNKADTAIYARFGIPDTVQTGEIIINELLSDPTGDGSRFFELYNNSWKTIDMQTLAVASENSDTVTNSGTVPLMAETRLVFPGDYFAFTTDPADIIKRYRALYPDFILKMNSFPSLGNDSGALILKNRSNYNDIDRFDYHKKLHYPLLSVTEGVSFERANPDMPSDYRENWHSASETAGFATPAYQNSQFYKINGGESRVTVSPEIFSPDNDGKDDLAGIIIHERDPSYSLNITIYNLNGLKVRQIVNNHYAGNENVFFWNGLNDNGQKCNTGIYIVFVEIIYPEGKVISEKKSVVLAGRF